MKLNILSLVKQAKDHAALYANTCVLQNVFIIGKCSSLEKLTIVHQRPEFDPVIRLEPLLYRIVDLQSQHMTELFISSLKS